MNYNKEKVNTKVTEETDKVPAKRIRIRTIREGTEKTIRALEQQTQLVRPRR